MQYLEYAHDAADCRGIAMAYGIQKNFKPPPTNSHIFIRRIIYSEGNYLAGVGPQTRHT